MKVAIIIAIFGFLLLAGCTSQDAKQAGDATKVVVVETTGAQLSQNASNNSVVAENENNSINESQMTNDSQQNSNLNETEILEEIEMAENQVVVFETNKGTFEAQIFVKDAPITGSNFVGLVKKRFYDGLTFHRVEPGFVVQGGDPLGNGMGGSDKTIPLEVKPNLKHEYGTLAMARSQNPNSASSQFYVVIGEASFLDGQYAVFGKVLGNGMEVVEKIKVGDKMNKVYIKQ